MSEVRVQELGLQTFTDETGETIGYYAIAFSLVHEGQTHTLVRSFEPDIEPGDMPYLLAIEEGKKSLLKKVLQGLAE